jgi:hypothetical protein
MTKSRDIANSTSTLDVDGGTIKLDGNYPVGSDNVMLGENAGASLTSGGSNNAFGAYALDGNTEGSNNVALGRAALGANTTANNNTAVGYHALTANTTGSNNVSLGRNALGANTTASDNTAVGYQAGTKVTTATGGVYLGRSSGQENLTGNNNTFVGYAAGDKTVSASNTFLGYASGWQVTSGAKNTFVGAYNGNQESLDLRTSSNNIVLSDGDGIPRMFVDSGGKAVFGSTINGTQSGGIGVKLPEHGAVWVVNNSSTGGGDAFSYYSSAGNNYRFWVNGNGQIAAVYTSITSLSDQRFKENIRDLDDGLSKVMQLQPRKFDWKEGKGKDITNDRGFIAQEFEEVFPDLVSEWKDEAPEGEEPYKAVSQDLIPTLVKAIQELSAKNDALEARIATLEG